METISVVIAAYNEEQRIAACIQSVAWADEVVVVDGMSTDATARLAADAGARVIVCPNQVIPEINKNVGLDQATGDWILSLDADERIPPSLAQTLRAFAAAPGGNVALRLPRRNFMLGAWARHGGRWPDYQIRFFKRGMARFQERLHRQPIVHGAVHTLPARAEYAIDHYPYRSISNYLQRMDSYTTSEAETLLSQAVRPSFAKLITQPIGFFVLQYVVQRGFLDGIPGLILAAWSAFYAFLKWAKLWEITHMPRQ